MVQDKPPTVKQMPVYYCPHCKNRYQPSAITAAPDGTLWACCPHCDAAGIATRNVITLPERYRSRVLVDAAADYVTANVKGLP